MKQSVHFMSETVEWETPQKLFDELDAEFLLDRDVCATGSNFKVYPYWDAISDGLSKDWTGLRCWMNPPYGREIGKWVKKASEATGGGCGVSITRAY